MESIHGPRPSLVAVTENVRDSTPELVELRARSIWHGVPTLRTGTEDDRGVEVTRFGAELFEFISGAQLWTVRELARHFSVTETTIERTLASLRPLLDRLEGEPEPATLGRVVRLALIYNLARPDRPYGGEGCQ